MSLKMNEAPYQRSPRTTLHIMLELCAALLIVWLAAVIYNFTLDVEFGVRAILMMVVALVTTAAIDALVAVIKHKKGGNLLKEVINSVVKNYSYVTAIIFTLCLPVYVSYYVVIIGCLFATGIKHCFGGFGNNIFNPAIVGRIVTQVAFPTAFAVTKEYADVTSSATLTTQYSGLGVKWLNSELPKGFDFGNLILGNYGGSLGETFTLLILALGIVLMVRKVINWRSSVFYLGTVAITALFIGFFIKGVNPLEYVLYHLCLGGLMFGAIFMITDPVTSPTSPFGKALIGVIAGLMTVLIRVAGSYPEGVMYSIAFINVISPAIDKFVSGRTTDGQFKKWGVIAGFLVASISINTALSVSAVNKANESTSSSVVEVPREEKLFGIKDATYVEVTLGSKPTDTHIVKTYLVTEKNIPVALGYELANAINVDASGHPMQANAVLGVAIYLADDKVTVNALDGSAGTAASYSNTGLKGVEKVIKDKTASEIANVIVNEETDLNSSATYTSKAVMKLVIEACTQYVTVDKFYNAFGVEEFEALSTTLGTNILSAYTYTVDTEKYVAYFVSKANGVSIDTGHEPETIYPTVAVSIKVSDDKIASAKVLTNATSHAWAKTYYSKMETYVSGLAGKDANAVVEASYSNYDAVTGATYSCEGLFKLVVNACEQYVNTDKAVLTGGAN